MSGLMLRHHIRTWEVSERNALPHGVHRRIACFYDLEDEQQVLTFRTRWCRR